MFFVLFCVAPEFLEIKICDFEKTFSKVFVGMFG
jgi:hypothetical protein